MSDFSDIYEAISAEYNPLIKEQQSNDQETSKELHKEAEKKPLKEEVKTPVEKESSEKKVVNENINKEEANKIEESSQKKVPDIKKKVSEKSNSSNIQSETLKQSELDKKETKQKQDPIQEDISKKNNSFSVEEAEEIKDSLKHVSGDDRFFLDNGLALTNLLDLVSAINDDHTVFDKYVTSENDHFAEWVKHALEMPGLANRLKNIKDKDEYLFEILAEM